jgi:hypothetical protein
MEATNTTKPSTKHRARDQRVHFLAGKKSAASRWTSRQQE